MLRALQRMQALAVMLVVAQSPDLEGEWDPTATFVMVAGIFGVFACWFVPVPWMWRLLLFLAACAAIWLSFEALLRSDASAQAVAYRRTDQEVEGLEWSHAAHCPGCGGFATVLRFDVVTSYPCPWCDARLLASREMAEAGEARVDTKLARMMVTARELWRDAAERRGHSVNEPGEGDVDFRLFEHFGVSVWNANPGFAGRLVQRYELELDLSIDRRVLLVPAELDFDARELGRAWRVPLPSHCLESPQVGDQLWLVYADSPEPFEALGRLRLGIYNLTSKDIVVLDRAGCSLWVWGFANRAPDRALDALLQLLDEAGLR